MQAWHNTSEALRSLPKVKYSPAGNGSVKEARSVLDSPAQSPSRPAAYLYLLMRLMAVAGVILVLLLAEGIARTVFPSLAPAREERAKFWRHDPLLGWANVPNSRGRFNHLDFSVAVSHNADGLRDEEYLLARTDKKRMLVVGDSFVWGFGVEAEERFTELLEVAHPDWEIINTGVSGYSTDQEFLYLRERGIRYRPDVVVLLLFHDGLAGNVQDQAYLWEKPCFDLDGDTLTLRRAVVPEASWDTRLMRSMMHSSYLGKMVFQVWNHYFRDANSPYSVDGSNLYGVTEDAKLMTLRLVAEAARLCKANGAQFVVLTQKVDRTMQERLRRAGLLEGYSVRAVDPAHNGTTVPFHFYHDAHWNPRGHRMVAATVDNYFASLGIWEPALELPAVE